MAKKYMQDPEERERNNLIRQKLAAEQKKVNDEAKRQLQEQKEQQEEEIEEEIDLTPAEPLFTTLLRKKGWYDIINQDGIIVDEDGLILPKGVELKAQRLRAVEVIVKRLNNEA